MKPGTFADWAARIEVFKTISAILQVRDFNHRGLCQDEDLHFENPLATVYFEHLAHDDPALAEVLGSSLVLQPTEIEAQIFGAMPGTEFFELWRDGSGRWIGCWITRRRVESLREAVSLEIERRKWQSEVSNL